MISKRLLGIASYIKRSDTIIDVGCDHGYLGIYLKQNNLCSNILLTDVRSSALNNAKNNIQLAQVDINTLKTDGLIGIDLKQYNTVTISGMGTATILKILKPLSATKAISKIIIQSNNDLSELRINLSKLGYYLVDETVIFEKNIWYVIGEYKLGYKRLTKSQIIFGIFKPSNIKYYQYLNNSYHKILDLIPNNKIFTKINIYYKCFLLKRLLKKCR
jgi:tRNA (adenine22-N1)-methyltransferase